MNKTQLVAAITDELNTQADGWTRADVKLVLETFESVVTESCVRREPVTITGFAKFAGVDRPARQGRNPATGETIQIKAKTAAKITPLKGFKDAVLNAPKPKNGKKKSKK